MVENLPPPECWYGAEKCDLKTEALILNKSLFSLLQIFLESISFFPATFRQLLTNLVERGKVGHGGWRKEEESIIKTKLHIWEMQNWD